MVRKVSLLPERPRYWFIALSTILGMFPFLFIFRSVVSAQQSPPVLVLELKPSSLTFHEGQSYTLTVVARNPTSQPVTNLRLSWSTNLDVIVSGNVSVVTELAPYGEIAWVLQLAPKSYEATSGTILFRLDYTWKPAEDQPDAPRIQLSELQIVVPTAPAIDNVAAIQVKSTLTNLNEQRPGNIYIILENKSSIPITITNLTASVPDFITATFNPSHFPVSLKSGQKNTISVVVTANDTVQPGKNLLLFTADLMWQQDRQVYQGTLVVSHELEVGILGESQILTVLGVPTLLLLPGFLIIVTVKTCWSFGKTQEEKARFPLPANTADFWFLAILASLGMAFMYPVITSRLLGVSRNYLLGYGLTDIYYIFLGSVLLGAFIYFVGRFVSLLLKSTQAWWQKYWASKAPSVNDDPKLTLKKLSQQGMTLKRDRVSAEIDGQQYPRLFLLQAADNTAESFWVAPVIRINDENLDDRLIEQVEKLREEGTDIHMFLALLPQLPLSWEPNWPYPGPRLVSRAEGLRFNNTSEMIVEFPETN